jgi:hypothetical protein
VEQHEDAAIIGPQLADGGLDLPQQLGRVVGGRAGCDILQVVRQLGPPGPLDHHGAAAVEGNAQDPRPQGPRRIPAVEAAEDAQEHLLRHVFRVVPVVQEPEAKPVDVGLEALDQGTDGVGVPSETASHQRGFLDRHVGLPASRVLRMVLPGTARSFTRRSQDMDPGQENGPGLEGRHPGLYSSGRERHLVECEVSLQLQGRQRVANTLPGTWDLLSWGPGVLPSRRAGRGSQGIKSQLSPCAL